MKRRSAALILMLGIMGTAVMTGCGSTNIEVDASKNEDLSAKVTDQNKVEDSSDAYQKFLDAQKAMEATDSLTVNSELLVSITTEGKKEVNSQRFNIKRAKIDDKQTVDFTMDTEMKLYNEDGTEDADNSHKRSLPGYFTDGMLYYEQPLSDTEDDGVKLKEEMDYDSLMEIIGSTYILNDVTAEQIETTATESKGGSTEYIYILNKDAMSEYMLNNLAASGMPFDEEGGVTINYANVSAEINKDGILTAYTFSVNAVVKDETGEVPFSYDIASAFTDINSTKVDAKSEDDFSGYITAEEYAKQLQQEQEELENMPVDETQGEQGTEGAETQGIDLELPEDQTAEVKIGE